MPQVVEVLKYVHEIYEEETLGVALSGDIATVEVRYRELYGNAKKQLEILLVELRALRTAHPNLRAVIEIIERYLIDFDRLAAAQRIVTVDREKVVEKEIERGVLVPSHDIRGELAMSLLVEKLVNEIKSIKKTNPNIKLSLEDDIGFIFFSEIYDNNRSSGAFSSDFSVNLKRFTENAIHKFTKNGGQWTSDHEFMLHSVLSERFAMANVIKQANEEIEKAKALAEVKGQALREKENQFQVMSKTIQGLRDTLSQLISNNASLSTNVQLTQSIDTLGTFYTNYFTIQTEPMRELGEWQGSGNDWNRLLSFIRERTAETEILKGRLIELEKSGISKEYSGVDSQRTIDSLRRENGELSREIDRLKTQLSQAGNSSSGNQRELEIKLKTANSRIQEL